jgi:hypothetical protein
MKRIAVIKNGKDILRIIPFKEENKKIHLKFSFFSEFKVNYWSLADKEEKSTKTSKDMTYHSSSGEKKPKVHIKEKDKVHKNIFDKVVDIDLNEEFPVPICKLNIFDPGNKKYKKNNKHIKAELEDTPEIKINTLELYLAPIDFNYGIYKRKWRCLTLLFTFASIDCLIQGPGESLDTILMNLSHGPLPLINQTYDKKFSLLWKIYREDAIKENTISFYENKDYIDILATTPVSIKTNGRCSKIMPAYYYDISDMLINNCNPEYITKWETRFIKSQKKLDNVYRAGIIIPRE